MALRLAPRLPLPPIFIVGLPRVGSTLASILATRHLRCAYFSNLLMTAPQSPVALAILAAGLNPFAGTDDLDNRHGETRSWRGPNQGYRFWKQYITAGDGSPRLLPGAAERLVDTVHALQGLAGGPLINKWQANVLRIPLLAATFPGALFVEIARDEVAIAASVLRARRESAEGEAHWFSVRPPGLGDISRLDPSQQIAAQIVQLRRVIDDALAALPERQVLRWRYGELCSDPDAWIAGIAEAYQASTGHGLHVRGRVGGPLIRRAASDGDRALFDDAIAAARG